MNRYDKIISRIICQEEVGLSKWNYCDKAELPGRKIANPLSGSAVIKKTCGCGAFRRMLDIVINFCYAAHGRFNND